MDITKFMPESHVAQQSRHDKLRIQQSSNDLVHHPDDFQPGFLHPVLNPDLIQVRNVGNANFFYHQSTFPSSNVTHFSENPDLLLAQRDEMLQQDVETAQRTTLVLADDSMSPSILTHFNAPYRVGTAYKGTCGSWKSIEPQQACDLMVSYASGSSSRECNQNPYGGAVLSNNGSESNISATTQYLKPAYDGNLAVQSTLINPCSEVSSQDCRRHYSNLDTPSPQLYNSKVLQDVVATDSVGNRVPEGASLLQQNIREAVRRSWATDYLGNQSGSFHFDTGGAGMDRPPVENWHRWKGEQEPRIVASDSTNQGLALSLSSNPPPKVYVARLEEDGLQSRSVDSKDPQDSKILEPSIIRKASGKSLQVIIGNSANINRQTGPLGPFTGYATILKNSRFLKPAQELLEDFCNMTNSKLDKICKVSEGISVEGTVSASAGTSHAANIMEPAVKWNNSCASSSTFYSSNGNSDGGLASRSSEQPYRPDYQQKARLLYLQEEVCKRYKLYHQQMQMVVSSFESVAGLSAATPYISLALKAIVKNFRSLKNAISDQIKRISKALGEDVFFPTSGTSSSKGEMNKIKYMGQKSGGVNVGFLEPQQHSWRPQRGLPERSVAILRAWLFDHFLHPYPTDTDKHTLATQTGLTRNQVSNWFINARVRVWKPMVEEIHMLESKGLAEANQIKSASEGTSCQITDDQAIIKPSIDRQLGSSNSDMHHMLCSRDACSADQWNLEKRSRVDFHDPTSMDGSLISFVPCQRSHLEMGGLGAVSLTLGLRHGADSARQQQQQQFHQQEDQLRRQFGGQMIHDSVGC